MLALGALVSVAASPVAAQMVIGGERPSVDVNWGVLDRLGPEPTLPGLVTRKAPPAKPAALANQGVVFKPYGAERHAATTASRPVKVVKAKVAAEPVAAPARPARPAVEAANIPDIPGVPPVEKVMAAPQPPKPPQAEVAADVPAPPRAAKPVAENKVKQPPAAPAPVEASAPPPAPAKVEPAPSAVQFAKAPELPPAPPPVAPPPPVAAPPVVAPVAAVPPPPPVVAVVPPPPVVAPAPAAPLQLAAVAPPVTSSLRKGDNLSVLFASESEHLPDSARGDLEKLAQKLERDEGLTLQLLAYAAGDEANASKARRLSLTRALKVRTYLMELGVRSTRIEVRALGNKIEGGPADRVDVVLGNR